MTFIEAVISGIVQGATEFLPVSSSGHLAIMHSLFGPYAAGENTTFDILLHMATLIAVILIYWKDILILIPAVFTGIGKLFRGRKGVLSLNVNENTALGLIIATLPLALAVFVKDEVEAVAANVKIVGALLILNGLMLMLGDLAAKKTRHAEIKGWRALFVGGFQLVALVPGISRSGSTITAGCLMGADRESAVRFSFLLSIPAILGANVFSVFDMEPVANTDILPFISGAVAAMVVGFAALKLIQYIAKKKSFAVFSVYCIIVGAATLIFG